VCVALVLFQLLRCNSNRCNLAKVLLQRCHLHSTLLTEARPMLRHRRCCRLQSKTIADQSFTLPRMYHLNCYSLPTGMALGTTRSLALIALCNASLSLCASARDMSLLLNNTLPLLTCVLDYYWLCLSAWWDGSLETWNNQASFRLGLNSLPARSNSTFRFAWQLHRSINCRSD
jgi:hypothetical protein